IGHLQLFEKGYLHREVTIWNVLARDTPQGRTPAMREKNDEILSDQVCLGYIIDGDLAIRWEQPCRPAKYRSGVLPFISYRIIHAWSLDKPIYKLHTAVDDLESFGWVLL
ncbi:hypothetical protein JB92DRAFT_2639253, partial [Gautieria morchelliformis]